MWAPWRSAMVRHTAEYLRPRRQIRFPRCRRWKMPDRACSALGVEARAVVRTRHPASAAALCRHGAFRHAGAGWCWLNFEGCAAASQQTATGPGRPAGSTRRRHAPLPAALPWAAGAELAAAAIRPPAAGCNGARPPRQGQQPSSILCHAAGRCSMVPTSLRLSQRRALQLCIGGQVAQHLARQRHA